MESFTQFALLFGKIFGIFLGIFIVFVASFVVYIDIWLKFHTRGKAVALFIDNKSISSALLTVEDGNKMYYGKGDKKEMYLLEDDKQCLSLYPAGLPRFLQIIVRTYVYTRNQPNPINPKNLRLSGLTSRMLNQISDEAMVKQTWKDAREAVGLVKPKTGGSIALYLLIGCFGINIGLLYVIMQQSSRIGSMEKMIQKVFGG